MATFKLQNNIGQIRQMGRGDLLGELYATRNINLSENPGKVKLSNATEQVMTDSDIGSDSAEAISQYDSKIVVLTDGNLYEADTPYTSWSTYSAGPTTAEDMTTYDNQLRIAESTDIASFDGTTYTSDWWSNGTAGTPPSLSASNPHNVVNLSSDGKDTLSVTDGNQIHYYNNDDEHVTIAFDDTQTAICQADGLNEGWVGTFNDGGQGAQVIRWLPGRTVYEQSYPVDANAVLAIEVVDNIPHIITEKGEIQRFNQAGFTTIAKLPFDVAFLEGVETGIIQNTAENRPVHPKGMKQFGKNLLVFVNTEEASSTNNVNNRCPAGVWEVDLTTGSCWHRHDLAGAANINISSPLFVVNDPNSRIYYSGQLEDNTYGLWREDLDGGTNRGFFVTTEYHSDNFEDAWHRIHLAALQDSNDSCVVKYRTSKSLDLPVVADITWTETNQFTTTDDLSNVVDGDEVEIIAGSGTGYVAHISEIVAGASVYTVTLDESPGTVASTATVNIDNWKKLDTHNTTELIKRIGINKTSPQMQFKVYMEGDSGYPEVSRMDIKTNNKE